MSLLPKLTLAQLTQQFYLDHGSLAAKLPPVEVEYIALLKRKADAHDTLAEVLMQKYIEDIERHKKDKGDFRLIMENIVDKNRKIMKLEQEITRLREENEYRRKIAENEQEITRLRKENGHQRMIAERDRQIKEQEIKDLKEKEAMRDAPRISARTRSQTNGCAA